jgi:hypothetical protein
MDAARWFATAPDDQPSGPVGVVLAELLRMLDAVRPKAMDRERSHVLLEGHGWHEYEAEIVIAHRDDEDAEITLAVGAHGALLSWLTTHDHIYRQDGRSERPWTTVAVDATAAVLRGEYVVEEHYRGDKLLKTRVRDVVEKGRTVAESGSPLALLPFFRRTDRVERRSIDFECIG